jgi:WD40 repeat protein
VTDVAVDQGGKFLATISWDGGAVVWDLAGNAAFDRLDLAESARRVAFSPDGGMLALGLSNALRGAILLRDVHSRKNIGDRQEGPPIVDLQFASDNNLVVADEARVRAWDLKDDWKILPACGGTTATVVTGMVLAPAKNYMAIACSSQRNDHYGWVDLWDTKDLRSPLLEVPAFQRAEAVALTSDSSTFAVLTGSDIRFWHVPGYADPQQMAPPQTIASHFSSGILKALALNSDGAEVAAFGDAFHLWRVSDHSPLLDYQIQGDFTSLGRSPGGGFAMLHNGGSSIYHIDSRREVKMGGDTRGLQTSAFSADGNYVVTRRTVGTQGVIEVWKTSTGERVSTHVHDGSTSVSISGNGGRFASFNPKEQKIRVWASNASEAVASFSTARSVCCMDLSQDGGFLSVGSDELVRMLEISSGKESIAPLRHQSRVVGMAYSNDLLATVSQDGFLRLWDSKAYEKRAEIETGGRPLFVGFSGDGRKLAIASQLGAVSVYTVDAGELADRVCAALPGDEVRNELGEERWYPDPCPGVK